MMIEVIGSKLTEKARAGIASIRSFFLSNTTMRRWSTGS
jgi:hypothetical protein